MAGSQTILMVGLTREEAQELFSRALRAAEDDTIASASALRKLARALEADAHRAPDRPAEQVRAS